MALSSVNSGAFDQGDTAVGADVLAEVDNILNNALTLISPLTGNLDCNAKQLVSIIPETVTSDPTGGTAGETYYQSTSKQLVVWNGTAAHTYVTRTAVETLTNKTLTQPRIGTNIRDTNGNELVVLTATASAVNELTLANAATGNNPALTASGDDSNISINLVPKGTGVLRVNGTTVATATNTLTVSGKTFSSPVINTSISGTAIGGTPSTQAIGDSAASGSSGVITRLDHKHGMPTYGTGAATVCEGNDSRLSDARTPTAHAVAGALHSADTWANFKTKISDAVPSAYGDSRIKIGSFTRDLTVASGSQSISGLGFQPAFIRFMAIRSGSSLGRSWGAMDGTTHQCLYQVGDGTGTNVQSTAVAMRIEVATNDYQQGNITIDSDGFTVTWTKSGSPTGSGIIVYEAYR